MAEPTPAPGTLTAAELAVLRELADDLESIVQTVSSRDGDATARQHMRAVVVRKALAALPVAAPPAVTGWQPIATLPDHVTALVIHQCDLYPVAAFRVREAGGREVWMSEVEGPEDDATRPGAYRELSRPPTHWKAIDWPIDHDHETCSVCGRPPSLGGPNG